MTDYLIGITPPEAGPFLLALVERWDETRPLLIGALFASVVVLLAFVALLALGARYVWKRVRG